MNSFDQQTEPPTTNKIDSSLIMDDYQPKSIQVGFEVTEQQSPKTPTTAATTVTTPTKEKSMTHNRRISIDQNEAKTILSSHIEIREKEIDRQTRFAEKDKKDSLLYVNLIKECKEQLHGYIKDFYENEEKENEHRKNALIEKSTALLAIESATTVSPLPFMAHPSAVATSSTPILSTSLNNTLHNNVGNVSSGSLLSVDSVAVVSSSSAVVGSVGSYGQTKSPSPLTSLSFWEHQNGVGNGSAGSGQQSHQHKNDEKSNNPSVSVLVSSYQNKDEELERVKYRANAESLRASYLREKYEELSQLVQTERDHWSKIIDKKKKEVESKEKEINRLLMVAETQKKKSMEATDQITKLKKSLDSISKIRANNSIDIKKINEKCSFESLSPSPNCSGRVCASPSFNYQQQQQLHYLNSKSPQSLHSSGSSSHSGKSSPKYLTEEKKDLIYYDKQMERKDEEIKRIRDIIEFEQSKTLFLTGKVNELTSVLEEESRQVDNIQYQTLREIREKEDAIIKVALRAQKERIKSNQINDQIKKLVNESGKSDPSKKSKKTPEIEPITSNFMEMGELKQFQDLSLDRYCDENILNKCCMGKLPISSLLNSSSGSLNASAGNLGSPYFTSTTPLNTSLQQISSSPNLSHSPKLSTSFSQLQQQQQQQQHQQQQQYLSSPTLMVRNQINSVVSNSINIPANRKLYQTGESPSTHSNSFNNNSNSINIANNQSGLLSKSPSKPSNSFNYSSSPSQYICSMNNVYAGSPSEVIMFKLKEIDRLAKETVNKEKELSQVKKIAEAERSRLCLLKDKFRELKSELQDKDTYFHEKYATKTY